MKIEIWEEEQKEEEQPLRLKLQVIGSDVELIAVDSKGSMISAGHLLAIRSSGRLFRESDISKSLGLELDSRGRVEEIVE